MKRFIMMMQSFKSKLAILKRRLRFRRVASRKIIDSIDLYPELGMKTFVTASGDLMMQSKTDRAPIIGVMEWNDDAKRLTRVGKESTVIDFLVIFTNYYVEGE